MIDQGQLMDDLAGEALFWKQDDKTPQSKFAMIAVLYLTAMFASNAALMYIPYPTQVSMQVSFGIR